MAIEPSPTLSNFRSVQAFHDKMGIPRPPLPMMLDEETFEFRLGFIFEEYQEIAREVRSHLARLREHQSSVDGPDMYYGPEEQRARMAKIADGLVDLAYVTFGMADMMGLPWEACFAEVQRANMTKQLAKSKEESLNATGRGHKLDVIKPPGWTPPNLVQVLKQAVLNADSLVTDQLLGERSSL